MSHVRQLSAILFTDIEGYTALMQENEEKAIRMRARHREVIGQGHSQFNGRVIQYYGDGTLSTFQSIVEAVQCTVFMQQQFSQGLSVPVRMGLHVGDILISGEEVIGDGVNLASRIESLGVAGCVLISDKANDELHNHPELSTASMGVFQFKNIKRPVEVFALAVKGLVIPLAGSLKGKTEEKVPGKETDGFGGKIFLAKSIPLKSIAVLPFINMSNDPEQEYFSEGMAEEIINSLTRVKELRVAGRTSSFQFKGKAIDLQELGEKLSVRTVLSGSVRKQGNWLRITAQLTNIEDGYHLWSERYDREITDVFAIQDDIALAITKKLELSLLQAERDLLARTPTQNTEAYELYLKGRFYVTRRGAAVVSGLQCFQQAIALDAGFALAHAAYADANLLIASYGLVPPKEVLVKAKQSAERALQLDPSLCEPYCSLGYYYSCYEWNWPEAKKNFLKSIEINPRYAEGHFRYGWNYLTCIEGKFDEAEKHAGIAIHLEPLSAICHAMQALILNFAGKYQEGLAACTIGLEIDPNSFVCHVNAGSSQLALKQYDEAITSFEAATRLSNRQFAIHGFIWVYCLAGQHDKALVLMNELKTKAQTDYVAKTFTALSAAYLNELEEAFGFLEQAFADRDPLLMMLKYERWVPLILRQDPRFQKFLERIGFPES